MSESNDLRADRERKLQLLVDAGMNPYPATTQRTHEIQQVLATFDGLLASEQTVTIAGRIMSFRGHGALVFLDIFDGTGKIQAFVSKEVLGEKLHDLLTETMSAGDFIEVTGTAYVTQRGMQAVSVSNWTVLAKALTSIPTEHFGIKDEDERYRKRYLDILLNREVRESVYKRAQFWQTIRTFLIERGYIEVETPVLENTPGGAEARPFITHHNALDIDVFLRISAGELWQKKLMVAGIPKTFEIGRIFRNEGMSVEHLQDYTQLEFYEAYSDYNKGMEMITDLYRKIAQDVFGTQQFSIRGHAVDFAQEWEVYDYCKLINDAFGFDPRDVAEYSNEEAQALMKKIDPAYEGEDEGIGRIVDSLWKTIRKNLAGPGFLINVPVYLEPLAKRSATDPRVVERFQVLIAGSEMGKGFSELNDPQDQKGRFMEQQALRDAGDDEAQMADMEYVEALEYGMPPTFGFGLSERLFAFLMDKPARETQIFPLMRPKDSEQTSKKSEPSVAVVVLNEEAQLEPWQKQNAVAHLAAELGVRGGKSLLKFDVIQTKDGKSIPMNIQHAIMLKGGASSDALKTLHQTAKDQSLSDAVFTREMIETTNDNKVKEITADKTFSEIEYLGVLIFGPRSVVSELTEKFPLEN